MKEYLVIGISYEGFTCSTKMEFLPEESTESIVQAFARKMKVSNDMLDEVLITDSDLDIRVLRRDEKERWL